ncbi:MAG TPA: IS481 family transposase [Acidimicrobiales bacterium]|nr:IS481 family transposase [Acidimicrobiales bacterium]
MTHANAPLSELGRLHLARFCVVEGASQTLAAERFHVSVTTVRRWSARYRAVLALGCTPTTADMVDRSSRPRCCPTRTRPRMERKIKHLRTKRRLGPVQIAGRVGVPASTVYAVLARHHLNRLAALDRATGEPIRRYEKPRPGDQVHVDVKKLALVPAGGGWRVHGRAKAGKRRWASEQVNLAAHTARGRGALGYCYVHCAVDDHSRLAYSEVLDDETAATAAAFWTRAQGFFAAHGITTLEVLTDNGSAYRSRHWRETLAAAGITHRRTRPYRPQTNGKVERFHRTLLEGWAYAKAYRSESARRAALDSWLHFYNHGTAPDSVDS